MAVYISLDNLSRCLSKIRALISSSVSGKADKTHTHSATDITSGTLDQARLPTIPISSGGTGRTTAKAANNAICGSLTEESGSMSDDTLFAGAYMNPSDSNGGIYKRKASTVWSYILGKIRGTFGFSTSNVLPVSHGGTGASDVSTARTNLGVKNPLYTPANLSSFDLNDLKGEGAFGAYYAGGGNGCKNVPGGCQHFGLLVLRSAQGWTTQLIDDANAGKLWVRRWAGSSWTSWVALVRTSDTIAKATKAVQDNRGQQIDSTYIKALSVSGHSLSYTKGDGSTGKFDLPSGGSGGEAECRSITSSGKGSVVVTVPSGIGAGTVACMVAATATANGPFTLRCGNMSAPACRVGPGIPYPGGSLYPGHDRGECAASLSAIVTVTSGKNISVESDDPATSIQADVLVMGMEVS